jgi:hypothetical protein
LLYDGGIVPPAFGLDPQHVLVEGCANVSTVERVGITGFFSDIIPTVSVEALSK